MGRQSQNLMLVSASPEPRPNFVQQPSPPPCECHSSLPKSSRRATMAAKSKARYVLLSLNRIACFERSCSFSFLCAGPQQTSTIRTLIVRMISTAQTGYFYTTQRPRLGNRLCAVKYDPKGTDYYPFPAGCPFHIFVHKSNRGPFCLILQ